MQPMRVFYTKKGTAKYISHLDINRCFQRAIKRAKIPIWHTEGFNPHAYITFALPLSLGYESECECVDFRLVQPIAPDEIAKHLNAVLPAGLQVLRAAEPEHKVAEIASVSYVCALQTKGTSAEVLEEKIRAFFAREEILALKKSKKGTKEISIKEHIEDLQIEKSEETVLFKLRLPAGTQLNLNPTLVLDAFLEWSGETQECFSVLKTGVFTAEQKEFR